MSYRSEMATELTYVSLLVCDVCKRDMEELRGSTRQCLTYGQHWELTTCLPADSENEYTNHICSLQCLVQWASVEGKAHQGLWLNGKSE